MKKIFVYLMTQNRYLYDYVVPINDYVWLIWISLVCIWNFGWPNVPAIADVIVAIILSFVVVIIKKMKK